MSEILHFVQKDTASVIPPDASGGIHIIIIDTRLRGYDDVDSSVPLRKTNSWLLDPWDSNPQGF